MARLEALENDNVGFDAIDGDEEDESYAIDQEDGRDAPRKLPFVKLGWCGQNTKYWFL